MADLIFSAAATACDTHKFDALYRNHATVAESTDLYYNHQPLTIAHGNDSATLLGCAAPTGKTTENYLLEALERFTEADIARIKTELPGQWILILRKGDAIYIYSDFMQIRPLYYAPKEQMVCSSFGPLHDTLGGEPDSYKCFEFLAMRHCLYPSWLGNTTLNRRIRSLRGYEYIKIGVAQKSFEVKELTFTLDNSKIESLDKAADTLRTAIEQVVQRAEYRNTPARTTITGGFDSRLISTFVRNFYPDVRLRIASFGQGETVDLRIARQVAKVWNMPLDIYTTDKKRQKERFFDLTDGLTPQENAITTELIFESDARNMGFGGVMGTEILMSLPYEQIAALTAGYAARARNNFEVSEEFITQFTDAIRHEFSQIETHYHFTSHQTQEQDRIRLFMAGVTSRFCGPQVAAFDLHGRQLEPLATYSVLAAALRIPYLLMGGKGTFGGFYLVPKRIMQRLDPRTALIDSTHFSPMYPFGVRTFAAYIVGKFFMRRRVAARRAAAQSEPKPIFIRTEAWSYRTTEWAEGFVTRYLSQYRHAE